LTAKERERRDKNRKSHFDNALTALENDPKNVLAIRLASIAVHFISDSQSEDRFVSFAGKYLLDDPKNALALIPRIGRDQTVRLDKLAKSTLSPTAKDLVNLSQAYAAVERWEERGLQKDADEALRRVNLIPRDAKPIPSTRADYDYAKKAAHIRFSIENLSVGKKLPNFSSRDLQGNKVQLSDHAGKVVLLDVWATWCIDCRKLIPHQRQLVDRLKNQPFALISISVDDKVEIVNEFQKQEKMPWHHWYAGPQSEVEDKLGVRFYPTLYLLDGAGVIRYKNPNDEHINTQKLDQRIDDLLKELGKTRTSSQAP
jgi:thiol-disulfide isomerase/thioredoxin